MITTRLFFFTFNSSMFTDLGISNVRLPVPGPRLRDQRDLQRHRPFRRIPRVGLQTSVQAEGKLYSSLPQNYRFSTFYQIYQDSQTFTLLSTFLLSPKPCSNVYLPRVLQNFGSFIPGHGGVTDRCDCMFLCAAIIHFYYNAFGELQ